METPSTVSCSYLSTVVWGLRLNLWSDMATSNNLSRLEVSCLGSRGLGFRVEGFRLLDYSVLQNNSASLTSSASQNLQEPKT